MSQKNALLPFKLMSAQSLSASFNGTPTDVRFLDNVAIQLNITAVDAVGSFYVQGSLDYNKGQDVTTRSANSGNWIDINLPAIPTVASANTQILLDLNQISFPYIRIRYARTSGGAADTMDVWISAKEV